MANPSNSLIIIYYLILCHNIHISYSSSISSSKTSIIFATIGRSRFNFDIYTLPITPRKPSPPFIYAPNFEDQEVKITDGISVNYNGYFPANSTAIFSLLGLQYPAATSTSMHPMQVIYISERNGSSNIYFDSLSGSVVGSASRAGLRSALELPEVQSQSRIQVALLEEDNQGKISMKDRPSLNGDHLIYVSTREDSGLARASWTAVYSTHLPSGLTRRLTPSGVADFSPAVSPSGIWTAVASYGEKGWGGEVEELLTDIYVFLTSDGSGRVMVSQHGGWPSWVDDHTLYFHRKDENDGWWSVYKASLPRVGLVETGLVLVERVTPPGLHAFTPATSPGNHKFIVVASRRPESRYRHIELFDLVNKEFKELTRPISPKTHHYNPFISSDSNYVGYHKCRGLYRGEGQILLENLKNPEPDISIFRIDGSYPSMSPTGDRIAYLDLNGEAAYVVDRDGSNRRMVFKGNYVFSTAWDPIRNGVIYTSFGPKFAPEGAKVDIISINVDSDELTYKRLTIGGANNAFPSPSPDGKWIVLRSGRSGYKNLYIMDAENGEAGGIHRLTEGPWDDTMANWSPDGEWIAFASDRVNPGSGRFELFMIHPNGTGLRKAIENGSGGRVNHPWFSPDMKSIVFTSDHAGVSAEPISYPECFEPTGEIFISNIDGSNIRRMTHNSHEDGTPTWSSAYMDPNKMDQTLERSMCAFEDCHWLNIKPKIGMKTYNASIRC